MRDHDRLIIHSSSECNWRTPPELFKKLDAAFHFQIDLAADEQSALCLAYLGPDSTESVDALQVNWAHVMREQTEYSTDPLVGFLNPPYSRARKLPLDPWVAKCWQESQAGCTIVALLPFAPQTSWYRRYVYGHTIPTDESSWSGHAAMEEWRIPHRVSFLRPDGRPASNAGVNSVVIVWRPNPGFVGPWQPAVRYWSYR